MGYNASQQLLLSHCILRFKTQVYRILNACLRTQKLYVIYVMYEILLYLESCFYVACVMLFVYIILLHNSMKMLTG